MRKKKKGGYQRIRCVQPSYFDVDRTLLMWGYSTKPGSNTVPITCEGRTFHLVPHKKHIEQIKAHWARGMTVIVWSAGGDQWADAVVRSLGLTKYVTLALAKPKWCFDDQPVEKYMPPSDFIKDE